MSDDGSRVVYLTNTPGNGSNGGAIASIFVGHRGLNGWSAVSADPYSFGSAPNPGTVLPLAASEDFTKILVNSNVPNDPGDANRIPDLYRVDVGAGTSTRMTKGLDRFETSLHGPIRATSDLGRVLFDSLNGVFSISDGATPQPVANGFGIGQASSRGLGVDASQDPSNSATAERGGAHGASDDLSVIYFMTDDNATGHRDLLNVREPSGVTAPVSISSVSSDVGTLYAAAFISASHDGSEAYFASAARLTDEASPGGGIYRFSLKDHSLTQITPPVNDPNGLQLSAAIASDDQSHIYFTSQAALADGAEPGAPNAYVWSSQNGTRFIARVGLSVTPDGSLGLARFERTTPDGRYALLVSDASIGGASNDGHRAIYRYDDTTGELLCASCRPDGSSSEGDADINAESIALPASRLMSNNRALSFNGDIAFTSTDRVVAGDQTRADDVYLFDGDRRRPFLLTSGAGDDSSFVGNISDDGDNVFVWTRSAFVGVDRDAAEFDVYDVRVDGGFAETEASAPPCSGDICQGPPQSVPQDPQPVSGRVAADGNAVPARIAKRITLARLTPRQRSTLARSGKLTVSVRIAGGRTVSLRGTSKGKAVGGGSAVSLGKNPRTMKVTFAMNSAARTSLRRHHKLTFRLTATLSGLKTSQVVTLKTQGAR
jgi:hypothetical protein